MLPERTERFCRRGVIDQFKKPPQSLPFRAPIFGVARVVDIHIEFELEELREGAVAELQHVASSADTFDEFGDGLQIDDA
jgi:hypothetical protein